MTTFIPHSEMPSMTPDNTPVSVIYCTFCGLPTDFCQYGPTWDKHPGGQSAEATSQQNQAPVVVTKSAGGAVIIKIAPRVGRRYLTTISGLEQFDVDLGSVRFSRRSSLVVLARKMTAGK